MKLFGLLNLVSHHLFLTFCLYFSLFSPPLYSPSLFSPCICLLSCTTLMSYPMFLWSMRFSAWVVSRGRDLMPIAQWHISIRPCASALKLPPSTLTLLANRLFKAPCPLSLSLPLSLPLASVLSISFPLLISLCQSFFTLTLSYLRSDPQLQWKH